MTLNATIQNVLAQAIVRLYNSSPSPEIDAEVLLSHSLNQSRAWLLAYQNDELNDAEQQAYQKLIERRELGEPIAYILEEREFWSLNLKVTPETLIPRPETEILVEVALEKAQSLIQNQSKESLKILDLGTGSGAIALSLIHI